MKLVIGIVRPEKTNARRRRSSSAASASRRRPGSSARAGRCCSASSPRSPALYGHAAQLGHQALAALVAPVYAFCATFALVKLIGLCTPLRVQEGEEAYPTGEGAILVPA